MSENKLQLSYVATYIRHEPDHLYEGFCYVRRGQNKNS